jgi:hypothetical protein
VYIYLQGQHNVCQFEVLIFLFLFFVCIYLQGQHAVSQFEAMMSAAASASTV